MATSFKEWPWPLQALFYLGLALLLVLAAWYVPGSPLASVRTQLESAQAELKPLEADVESLRVYKQRRAELQSDMDALQKQLATLQTIVPEEKQTDQFILMVQRAATSGVTIRTLTAQPVAQKEYYFEMPFQIQADGPYYSVLDFFSRMGRLSRIINVGDLKLTSLSGQNGGNKFRVAPGTSVTGEFTITTFFTGSAEEQASTQKKTSAKAKR